MKDIIFTNDHGWMLGSSLDKVYVVHNCSCCCRSDDMVWWLPSKTHCDFCNVLIPDDIRGLAMLHAWDR